MRLDPVGLPSTRTLMLVGGVGALVALLAGGLYLWSSWRERRTEEAWATVSARVQPALAPDAAAAMMTEASREIERFLAEHPSARTAGEAAYVLGNLRFRVGQYPPARAAWDIASTRATSPTVRALAHLGTARAWEAERDFAQASAAYQALLAGIEAKHFVYEDALLGLARVQELGGQKAEAVASYRRILKDAPAARHAEEAKIRLASLSSAR